MILAAVVTMILVAVVTMILVAVFKMILEVVKKINGLTVVSMIYYFVNWCFVEN